MAVFLTQTNKTLDDYSVEAQKLGISYGKLQAMETSMLLSERYRVRVLEEFESRNDDFWKKNLICLAKPKKDEKKKYRDHGVDRKRLRNV